MITLYSTASVSDMAMSSHKSRTVRGLGDLYGVTVSGTDNNMGSNVFNIVYSSQFNFTYS